MALSKKELDNLLHLIGLTRDREINCEQCQALVAEFAERQLEGKTIPEGLEAVEHHLDVCAECREEYGLLQEALMEMDEGGGGEG